MSFPLWEGAEATRSTAHPAAIEEIRGIHDLRWAAGAKKHFTDEFNDSVDCVRADRRRGGQNADLTNKDKTRAVQFIPPLDVFEKVIAHLVKYAEVTPDAARKLTGEEMVLKIAAVDAEQALGSLRASDVPPGASQQSINGAVSLAQWFKKSFRMTAEADNRVAAFRARRIGVVEQLPNVTLEALVDLLGKSSPQEVHPPHVIRIAGGRCKVLDGVCHRPLQF